jgi:MATE family multidrug resistance protein
MMNDVTTYDGSDRHLPILRQSRSRSQEFQSASPLVRESIQRDLEASIEVDEDGDESDSSSSEATTVIPISGEYNAPLATSYRRGSYVGAGNRGSIVYGLHEHDRRPTREEREEARREERSLLRDNNVIPPKHPQEGEGADTFGSRLARKASIIGIPGGARKVVRQDEDAARERSADASEQTPLIGDPTREYGGQDDADTLDKKWMEAVAAGKIKTTWQREAKTIGRYSGPLIVTFILQYSLTVASIFTVGHLGTVELGAVSLASMSANITGYAIYQGLATSLDTLCAQAYGSGKRKLVGLQTQRMIFFLWVCTIPIGVVWIASPWLLRAIVPDRRTADLAGLYLQIILAGAPGYAAFESGKRYLQAQGIFHASLYVLLIAAPLNALMNYLFVWQFNMGFKGAPIAVAIIDNVLPLLLLAYIRFFGGRSCWPGFTRHAWQNWGPMVRLALPGLLMVEAEVLAFEILTLAASYFGTTVLAAQSVVVTATSITWQIPFPVSIATSTRIANLIGASLPEAAKVSAKVGMYMSAVIGVFNFLVLALLRNQIPRLFSSDPEVIAIVAHVLPICAAFQLFDALAANCNGILRGIGRQEIGGWVQLGCYYAIAMPISMGTAFGAGWGIEGLWLGVALALGLVAGLEGMFIYRADWNRSVMEAKTRGEMG